MLNFFVITAFVDSTKIQLTIINPGNTGSHNNGGFDN